MQIVNPFEAKMWSVILGYINKPDSTSELLSMRMWVPECVLLCTYPWTHTHTHKQDYVVVHQLAGPSKWPLAVRPWVATQLPNLSPSPLLLRANLLAVHPHHTLYKLPLHLTCPSQLSIIDEWVALPGRERLRGEGKGEERAGLRARRRRWGEHSRPLLP